MEGAQHGCNPSYTIMNVGASARYGLCSGIDLLACALQVQKDVSGMSVEEQLQLLEADGA